MSKGCGARVGMFERQSDSDARNESCCGVVHTAQLTGCARPE